MSVTLHDVLAGYKGNVRRLRVRYAIVLKVTSMNCLLFRQEAVEDTGEEDTAVGDMVEEGTEVRY